MDTTHYLLLALAAGLALLAMWNILRPQWEAATELLDRQLELVSAIPARPHLVIESHGNDLYLLNNGGADAVDVMLTVIPEDDGHTYFELLTEEAIDAMSCPQVIPSGYGMRLPWTRQDAPIALVSATYCGGGLEDPASASLAVGVDADR